MQEEGERGGVREKGVKYDGCAGGGVRDEG